jgi:hypothetical protein
MVPGLLTALITACGAGPMTPSSPEAGGVHPGVTPRQAVQVLGIVDAVLVRASTARDATLFGNRVIGPAKEAMAASIKVQSALKMAPYTPASPSKPRLLLTAAGAWPRWFLAAGTSPSSPTPVLRVLYSQDPRSPYAMWTQMNLLPGATLPEIAPPTIGAQPLAPSVAGLVRTPAVVLSHYAEVLGRGEASDYQNEFAPDDFRTQLTDQLGRDRAAFSSIDVGVVTSQYSVAPDGPLSMATTDGGALVIGRIDQLYQVVVAKDKGSVALDQQLAALAGRATVTTQLQRTAAQTFAFYVPKAGGGGKVVLLAASKSDTGATGS